jgi:hypothetical protein
MAESGMLLIRVYTQTDSPSKALKLAADKLSVKSEFITREDRGMIGYDRVQPALLSPAATTTEATQEPVASSATA